MRRGLRQVPGPPAIRGWIQRGGGGGGGSKEVEKQQLMRLEKNQESVASQKPREKSLRPSRGGGGQRAGQDLVVLCFRLC